MFARLSAVHRSVHPNTTLRWRHRFLCLPREQRASVLAGIAEGDETDFLESNKGQRRGMSRPARKRGGKASKRGLSKDQIPVLICRDRAGREADFVLDKDDQARVSAALRPILAADTVLCTDASKTLAAVAKEIGLTHRPVNLAAAQRVVAGAYHVQNVNAYDSRLKQWMRRFHGVATRSLPNYLRWRRFLEQHNDDRSPANVLRAALGMDRVQYATVGFSSRLDALQCLGGHGDRGILEAGGPLQNNAGVGCVWLTLSTNDTGAHASGCVLHD